jgi:NAD(P)-dependent dehydrogenase (short-subunit alcohol dehydrogenase family)
VSKLANVLFTVELARRLDGEHVHSYALHPGRVASDVWRRVPWPFRGLLKLFMISNEQGAATTLHCALSEQAASETGRYYDDCRLKEPSAVSQDPALAKELWSRSEEWVA